MLKKILDYAINKKASDIHLTKNLYPTLRINGELVNLKEFPILDDLELNKLVKEVLQDDKLVSIFNKEKKYDASMQHGDSRFRIHIYKQSGSPAFALRVIPVDIPNIESLYLPSKIKDFANFSNGLILITGTTGSGKSTTLAALIDMINRQQSKHIITIEDPIEFVHHHKKSIINQREVGDDVDDFSKAVRDAMREDPDILLLGEMRDLDTIRNAITMAETGHLVFATLHTKSAAESVDRIIDVFPPEQQEQIRIQLVNTLRAIVSQQLIPKKEGGRVPLCEIMVVNPAIKALIKEKRNISAINDTIESSFKTLNSQSFDQALGVLFVNGLINSDIAHKYSSSEEKLRRFVQTYKANS